MFGARAQRAFTLVEMLVVVAILGLLLAILLPSLQAAKEHAYDAKCRANMKNIYKTLFAKENINGGPVSIPGPRAWISAVSAHGSEGLLLCPKDDDEGTAGAVGMEGSVTIIEPPKSVVFNAFESNTVIHGFIEQEGYALPSDVAVNILEPGRYGRGNGDYNKEPGTIAAGTVVDCYFLVFDPVGSQSAYASGSITFGADILGMICRTSTLDISDRVLAHEGTKYPVGQNARGYEANAEEVEITDDRRTLKIINYHSTFPGEHCRILTHRGGLSSYAMNDRVTPSISRAQQILLLEYDSSIADPEGMAHMELLQPRHFGRVNVLYTSGEVEPRDPEDLDPQNEDWKAVIGK